MGQHNSYSKQGRRKPQRAHGERSWQGRDRKRQPPDIGDITGYWDELEALKVEDRERKQAKVDRLITRARACRTFDGLEKVADDARADGLWDADGGKLRRTIGQCNGRLRGRHAPVNWRLNDLTVTVSDNKCVNLPGKTARDLSAEGWQYAGQAD